MTVYAADFGAEATTLPGVTEYSAAGAVTVARTSAGVVAIGSGLFVRDFTPNASTAVLVWDADGITASEVLTAAAGGLDAAGVRAAIGMTAANLDTQLGTLLPTASYTAPDNTSITAIKAKTDNLPTDPASNTQVNTRLAASAYVAPDNATIASIAGYLDTEIAAILAAVDTEITAIKAKTDALPIDTAAALTALTALVDDLEGRLTAVRAGLLDNLTNLDAAITSRLAASGYTAPDNTSIAAIKAKTDNLPADPAGVSDVQITGGFDAADRILLQNVEQEALGARSLNLGTGTETVSRTGRTDKTRILYKDAAKTQPVTSETDAVLGTSETA